MFNRTFVSTLIAATVAFGALASTVQPSAAKKLTPWEAAAIAGVGGFVVGALVNQPHPQPVYDNYYEPVGYGSSHVQRCYNRYKSYDIHSDTYVGYDGYRHYCQL